VIGSAGHAAHSVNVVALVAAAGAGHGSGAVPTILLALGLVVGGGSV
jgi:hypothetical protein